MRLIRRPTEGIHALSAGCVATIGVFDGVHRGHQQILGQVVAEAGRRGLPALVFSFEPMPGEYFSPQRPPARLTRLREKAMLMQELGVDWLFCPPFDARMEAMTPAQFIEQLLVRSLHVHHLIVGDDFRFGRQREGTLQVLREAGRQSGFSVEQLGSVTDAGRRVSSTAVRQALADGEMKLARQLLGRWYSMSGRVVHGRRLGRRLGMPTANIAVGRRCSPVSGVFAVRVGGVGDGFLPAVASLGTRPTVGGGAPVLEVHLFDVDEDLYGRILEVQFVARLRDELKFPDLPSLQRQMHQDAQAARQALAAV